MRARHEVKAGSEVRFIAGRVAKEGKHERVSADLVAAPEAPLLLSRG